MSSRWVWSSRSHEDVRRESRVSIAVKDHVNSGDGPRSSNRNSLGNADEDAGGDGQVPDRKSFYADSTRKVRLAMFWDGDEV